MGLSAPLLSAVQGTKEVLGGYFMLAPSVLIVSVISVFRGWFQGKNNMFPTAASEIVEQLVKVGFGVFFAYLFRNNVERAVIFLLLAVTLSEIFALLLMIFFYKRVPTPMQLKNEGCESHRRIGVGCARRTAR